MSNEQSMPDAVWQEREFTSIHAVILQANVEQAATIANILSPTQYDELIDTYQAAIVNLITTLRRQRIPIGDYSLQGGCCKLYFFAEDEVRRNYELDGPDKVQGQMRRELIEGCRAHNQHLVVSALRVAIQLKNLWLIQPYIIKRLQDHLSPWELGIGLHYGRVFLKDRAVGRRHVEGYALYWADYIQRISPQGSFSHIFLSRRSRDIVLRSVLRHTQLSQRVFFNQHNLPDDSGTTNEHSRSAYELKGYHRIGVHVAQEVIDQYELVFHLDPENSWAYYQLADYYSCVKTDWNRVFEYASIMRVTSPQDEKPLLDLAKYYLALGKPAQSRQCAEEALRINESFDLALEHLAFLASQDNDLPRQIELMRKTVHLNPQSAVNNFNIGLALLELGETDEGLFFVQRALRIYPEYQEWQIFRESLLRLKQEGKLPEMYHEYLRFHDEQTDFGERDSILRRGTQL